MRVLITRSGNDAENLARELGGRGFDVLVEPLLDIQNLEVAPPDFSGTQAIIFTSANGVRALAGVTGRRDIRVMAVGETSARAAREAGFSEVESADGDIEALGDLIEGRLEGAGGELFHVAGAEVAGDLERRLTAAGFKYRRQVFYQAVAPRSLSVATVAQIKEGAVEAVLFYSPRTVEIFLNLARKARIIKPCREMTAYCLSSNVAAAARKVPWRNIRVASSPNEEQLLSLLQEMTPPPPAGEAGAEAPAPTPEGGPTIMREPVPPQKRSGVAFFFTIILLLVILTGGGLALLRGWSGGTPEGWLAFFSTDGKATQKAAEEAARKTAAENARVLDITGRVAKLESKIDLRGLPELQRLKAERNRLKARLDSTLNRLASLEAQMGQVKKEVEAISQTPATDSSQALRQLSSRLGQLEKTVSAPAPKKTASVTRLEKQIARLEKKLVPEPTSESTRDPGGESRQAQAFLLALGQWRVALRSARPYGDELASLIAVAGQEPEIASLTSSLGERADQGIPTLGMLRGRFKGLASDIVLAEGGAQAKTWLNSTLARLRSSVRWRRTDDLQGTRAEAVVARAEAILETGNLAGAIRELEALKSGSAKVAKEWLEDARALVSAEKVLAALQVRAVARIAALDK